MLIVLELSEDPGLVESEVLLHELYRERKVRYHKIRLSSDKYPGAILREEALSKVISSIYQARVDKFALLLIFDMALKGSNPDFVSQVSLFYRNLILPLVKETGLNPNACFCVGIQKETPTEEFKVKLKKEISGLNLFGIDEPFLNKLDDKWPESLQSQLISNRTLSDQKSEVQRELRGALDDILDILKKRSQSQEEYINGHLGPVGFNLQPGYSGSSSESDIKTLFFDKLQALFESFKSGKSELSNFNKPSVTVKKFLHKVNSMSSTIGNFSVIGGRMGVMWLDVSECSPLEERYKLATTIAIVSCFNHQQHRDLIQSKLLYKIELTLDWDKIRTFAKWKAISEDYEINKISPFPVAYCLETSSAMPNKTTHDDLRSPEIKTALYPGSETTESKNWEFWLSQFKKNAVEKYEKQSNILTPPENHQSVMEVQQKQLVDDKNLDELQREKLQLQEKISSNTEKLKGFLPIPQLSDWEADLAAQKSKFKTLRLNLASRNQVIGFVFGSMLLVLVVGGLISIGLEPMLIVVANIMLNVGYTVTAFLAIFVLLCGFIAIRRQKNRKKQIELEQHEHFFKIVLEMKSLLKKSDARNELIAAIKRDNVLLNSVQNVLDVYNSKNIDSIKKAQEHKERRNSWLVLGRISSIETEGSRNDSFGEMSTREFLQAGDSVASQVTIADIQHQTESLQYGIPIKELKIVRDSDLNDN